MLKILRILFILPMILSFCLSNALCAGTQMPSDLDDDTLFLAATLWGETKNNDSIGMQVVANTVLNRKKYYEQQAKNGQKLSIKDIVSNTEQYASWKDKNWDTSDIIKSMAEYQGTDKEKWSSCIRIAKLALKGALVDITGGATGYYVKDSKDSKEPDWARGQKNITTINNHVVVRGMTMEDLKDSSNNVMVSGGSEYKASNQWESFTPFPKEVQTDSSGEACNGVEALSRDISSATDSGYGIISDKTMKNMTEMLNRIYQNLGRVFMLGHGLLCYASKVAYTCIGMDIQGVVSACWVKSPHLSFFFTGLAIYFTAFLMSIAIGMYFIDISFKLGFALMYLPIAVALWPFAPTRSKFGEVFGMILHNAMLYAFMSIGLTYAIVLIYNGILGDVSHWSSFWDALEKESSEKLAENFSIGSTRVMVILFCLIFGFKILASSVNEYLDYFFSDGLMSGQSPMHYLGTQAMGMTAGMTLGKIGGYAADVASTQVGKVVEGGGNILVNASNSDFGNFVSNAKNDISNRFFKARQYVENLVSDKPDNATKNPTIVGRTTPVTPTPAADTPATSSSAPVASASNSAETFASESTLQNNATSVQSPQSGQNSPETAKEDMQSVSSSTVAHPETSAEIPAQTTGNNTVGKFFDATRPDENTLRPSNIISRTSSAIGSGLSGIASAVMHPQVTYRTMKQLATENISNENSRFQNGKIIITNTGRVIYRKLMPESLRQGVSTENSLAQNVGATMKNAAVEGAKTARATVSDTVGFTGRMFQGLGKSMQRNWDKGGSGNFYQNMMAQRDAEEKDKYYENLINRTDAVDDNENG